jgi:hypothetical protein
MVLPLSITTAVHFIFPWFHFLVAKKADWHPHVTLNAHVPVDLIYSSKDEVLHEMFSSSSGHDRAVLQEMGIPYQPMVASLFTQTRHDNPNKTEPSPPRDNASNPQDIDKIYAWAVAVCQFADMDWSVALAIEELGEVNYVVNDLDQTSRDTLLGFLDEGPEPVHWWDIDRVYDYRRALYDALSPEELKPK